MSETTILLIVAIGGGLLTLLICAALLLTAAQFAGLRGLIEDLVNLLKNGPPETHA